MIKLKNNQKGMSLVEVMMAVAISSIVSLAVMKINENGMKGFNKVQTDTELNEFVGMIRTNLSNSTNCMFSLGETRPDNLGNTTADRPVPTIYRGTNAGGTWAVAGDKIPGGGWMLNSMTRRAFETNGGGLQGVCNLDLDVTRVKVAFGVTNKTVTIPIFCNINLSNEVESCESASTANDNYWTKNYEPGYEYLNYVSSINPGTGLPTGPSYVVVGPSRDAMVDPVIASLDINQDGFDWLLPQFMTGVRMPRENVLTWQQWGITESFNQVVVGEDCVAIMARNLADTAIFNHIVHCRDKSTFQAEVGRFHEVDIVGNGLNITDATGATTAGLHVVYGEHTPMPGIFFGGMGLNVPKKDPTGNWITSNIDPAQGGAGIVFRGNGEIILNSTPAGTVWGPTTYNDTAAITVLPFGAAAGSGHSYFFGTPTSESIVSGRYSVGIGGGNAPATSLMMTGNYNLGMGEIVELTNNYNFGFGNTVGTGNQYAFVFGQNSFAEGLYSMAFGANAYTNNQHSLAYGNFVNSIGFGSAGFGRYTVAQGDYSLAFGQGTLANPTETASAYSLAFGYRARTTGGFSTAIGNMVLASGNYSFAYGSNTNATGTSSLAFGSQSTATSSDSLAFGRQSSATNHRAVAIGYQATASAVSSYAIGEGATSTTSNKVVLGAYNDDTATGFANGVRLVVGGGTGPAARKNALRLDEHGGLRIGGGQYGRLTFCAGHGDLVIGKTDFDGTVPATFQRATIIPDQGNNNFNMTIYGHNMHFGDGGGGVGAGSYTVGAMPVGTTTYPAGGLVIKHFNADGNQTRVGLLASRQHASLTPAMINDKVQLWVNETNSGGRQVHVGAGTHFYQNGVVQAAGAWTFSDERLKKNFQKISDPLEKLLKLNSYRFTWKDFDEIPENLKVNYELKHIVKSDDYGFKAQEVEKHFPELLQTHGIDKDSEYKVVGYGRLIPILVSGVQELYQLVKDYIKKVLDLDEDVIRLQGEVEVLKLENRQIKEALCIDKPSLSFCIKGSN